MSRNVRIEGLDDLFKQLNRLGDAGRKQGQRAINETTQQVRTTAIRSISRDASRGRVYEKYRPRRTHVASAPGDAPNTDTGRLVSSIKAIVRGDTGRVGTNLKDGYFLEVGTQDMDARPWLFPALENNRAFFRDRVEKAVERAVAEVTK